MTLFSSAKRIFIGHAKNPQDSRVFHQLSLIAFFAWVGLGADGLSSSCYGPEAAFLALGEHRYLGIFVALLSAITVFLISASYAQIIRLFPAGGGGYLVASKLLSPNVGMVSGCALLIDYVLTISISIVSGADALFSFLPIEWQPYKILFALAGIAVLMVMNLRGVKESVMILTPIFMLFVITHLIVIVYAVIIKMGFIPEFVHSSVNEISITHSQVGMWGLIFIIMRAYSLGAGTFTGIEAVSNGLAILREPKAETGQRTMGYMAISLAFTVVGLMAAYLLFNVHPQEGKTLNAVLFESVTHTWSQPWGRIFILVTLLSEAMLLFVAAQAGFLDGPRVLASMANDRWMPSRFSSLSDRLVSQNGILLMGLAALLTVVATHGSMGLLIVLYSINVFITFCLSQAGMVRHWWLVRKEDPKWKGKISINGLGLLLTSFILLSVIILKFHDGGWVTILITGVLVVCAINIKKHYKSTLTMLHRLNALLQNAAAQSQGQALVDVKPDPQSKTAVILVNGYNGLGLHTVMGVFKIFGKEFKNFVFLQVGVIDAGNFKGHSELESLQTAVEKDLNKYVAFMKSQGYYAEGCWSLGIEVVQEVVDLAQTVNKQFSGAVFFGGQLVFTEDNWVNHFLHNYTVFAIQRKFYQKGIPFMILPIKV
jgi:amino acid transporter